MGGILLVGYFGSGNFGDEWMLASFLQAAPKIGISAPNCRVLTRSPLWTEREHGIKGFGRNWKGVREGLKQSTLVVGCGGSLLQDVTSFRSLAFYSLLIWVAKQVGKKVALLGQGLGPLRRPFSRALARFALSCCDLVCFRDPASLEEAIRIGVPSRRCFLTADLTFLWEPIWEWRPGFTLVINFRPVKGVPFSSAEAAQVLRRFLNLWGGRALFVPLQRGVDEKALYPLSTDLPAEWWRPERWKDGLDGLRRGRVILAMRLHALIAASLSGIPFVGVCYDPKISGIFGETVPQALLPFPFSPALLEHTLHRVMVSWEEDLAGKITLFVRHQRERSWQNLRRLEGLL